MHSVNRVDQENDYIVIYFNDSRIFAVPKLWFPKLSSASCDELRQAEISPYGIHWPSLDEDISIGGLLEGRSNSLNHDEFSQRWAKKWNKSSISKAAEIRTDV